MPLTPGTRLGPYEILQPLGAGGMGEVYRARDSRLGRDVAIKVLPEAFAADRDRRERFEREAQTVAALSHPNIVAVFDTGIHDGQAYVVMELLAGSTLRDRLAAGAMPARKAVDIAVQIARGLGAAHAKGLVHRDLKPENIFLLDDGQVKILDFGLARQSVASDHSGATRTTAATDPGTVMGTVGYMAPEQVRAQPVDARADLFAFGAVLHEILSGRRAFQRDTSADTMTAILTQDPPEIAGTRPDLSPALDRIVRHCLEKNANERFQSARDVAFALEALSGSTTGSGGVTAAAAPQKQNWRRWLSPVAALVVGVAAGTYAGSSMSARRGHPVTFTARTWDPEWITNARIAPDGETIVYSAARAGNVPTVFAIRAGSITPQAVGPNGTQLLAISRKNELAVLSGARLVSHRVFSGTLMRMTLDGAQRAVLENVTEADWAPDGEALAVIHDVNGQSQLEYPIGRVLARSAGYLSDPRVSHDGTRVAFMEHQIPSDNRGVVKVVDQSGKTTTLTPEFGALEGLAWTADDRTVAFGAAEDDGILQPHVVEASGRSTPEIAFSNAGELFPFDVAGGQTLVARLESRRTIWGHAPGAGPEREYEWLDFSTGGIFSADGRLMVFTDLNDTAGADYQVALRRNDGSPVVRLAPGAALGLSPDGKTVLAIVPSQQQVVLYPTGTGTPVKLDRGPIASYRYVGQWFADGKRVLLCGTEKTGARRCYQQSIDGGAPAPITPDGVDGALLARDDTTLFYRDVQGDWLTTLGSSAAPRHVSGLLADDRPLTLSNDHASLFVQTGVGVPLRVNRVDLVTGARTPAAELAPPDLSGVIALRIDQWADDGRVYTYRMIRTLSTLFIAQRRD